MRTPVSAISNMAATVPEMSFWSSFFSRRKEIAISTSDVKRFPVYPLSNFKNQLLFPT